MARIVAVFLLVPPGGQIFLKIVRSSQIIFENIESLLLMDSIIDMKVANFGKKMELL